jgi:hypothetical protein
LAKNRAPPKPAFPRRPAPRVSGRAKYTALLPGRPRFLRENISILKRLRCFCWLALSRAFSPPCSWQVLRTPSPTKPRPTHLQRHQGHTKPRPEHLPSTSRAPSTAPNRRDNTSHTPSTARDVPKRKKTATRDAPRTRAATTASPGKAPSICPPQATHQAPPRAFGKAPRPNQARPRAFALHKPHTKHRPKNS